METVLVVEDDRVYARTTTNWLVKNGINARYVLSVDSAKVFLEGHKVDLLLSDFRLNDSNGVELLEWMKAQGYRMPFLIMTGYGDIPGAVEAVKRGAADYLPKPIQTEKVLGIIRGLLNRRNRKKVKERAFYVGKSPLAVKLQNIVRVVAPADSLSVLIRGASGTGKEYVARQVHALSGRADAPFIAVDCGVLPKELAASELFGHVKGAFTGATENKTGMFAAANHGTLFLDEVEGMSPALQVKLLRTLQEREVMRVGGNSIIHVDVRIVAATNEALERKVRDGTFRRDLYYRLNTLPVVIPPLTERGDDMFLLMDQFRRELNGDFRLTEPVQDFFRRHTWPGNIRELRNVVEYFIYTDHRDITMEDLPPTLLLSGDALSRPASAPAAQQDAPAPSMSDSFRFVLALLYAASEAGTPMGRDKLLQKGRKVAADKGIRVQLCDLTARRF